jgi:lipid A disaccharide synthetase
VRLRQTVTAVMDFRPHVVVTVDAKGFSFRVLRSITGNFSLSWTLSVSLSWSWSRAIPDYCKVGDFAAFQVPKEHSFYSEVLAIDVVFLSF